VADDPRFSEPLYTVAQAARLVGMPPSTLATWSRGYHRHFPGRRDVVQPPVVTALQPHRPGAATIPFAGLVEATVVQAFRRTQLPLQRIRRALDVLTANRAFEHPLASRRLYTDGAEVLFDYASESEDGQLRLLTVVSSGQRVFHEVILDFLKRIHYDDGSWPVELIVPSTRKELLRVRPEVASGDPIFMRGGAPLSSVISRYRAGESIDSLSADYGVPTDDLEGALVDLGFATSSKAA